MIEYVVLGVAALAILVAGRQQAQAKTASPTQAPAQVVPASYSPIQPTHAQEPEPADSGIIGPILPRINVPIPQGEECSVTDNQLNAQRWLIAYCPEYFDNNCGNITYNGYTMTGGPTYFFEYDVLCFKEGAWGIPIPTTMTFTVVMRDCQMVSYSYR